MHETVTASSRAADAGPWGWARRHRFALLSAAGLLLTIVVLWLPTGWRSPDNWDVWYYIRQFDQGETLLFHPSFPTRPLNINILAYVIDPTSFLGFNLVLAGLLLIRGALTITIVSLLLRGQHTISFLCGVLSVVYPADSGMFYLSALNIHVSVVFLELAVFLLLLHWKTVSGWALAGALVALTATLGVYEAGLPLIIAAPLLLWWIERRFSRRLFAVSAIWLILAAVVFALLLIAVRTGAAAYQSSIVAGASLPSQLVFGTLFAYSQTLQSGFADGASQIMLANGAPALLGLAIVAGVGCSAMLWRLWRTDGRPETARRSAGGLAAIGILAIPLGYLVYMPTFLFFVAFRTMYFTSWVAAIALGCGLYAIIAQPVRWRVLVLAALAAAVLLLRGSLSLLGRADASGFLPLALLALAVIVLSIAPRPWALVLPAGLLFGVSMLYQLEQHRVLDRAGRSQTAQLAQIVQQAPEITPGTLVLLLNQTGPVPRGATPLNITPANFVFSDLFDNALNVIYRGADLEGRQCNRYSFDVGEPDCVFTPEGVWTPDPQSAWVFTSGGQRFAYDRVIAFTIDNDGTVTLQQRIPAEYAGDVDTSAYQPDALIDRDAPPPPRALTMLPS